MELEEILSTFRKTGTAVVSDAMGRSSPLPGVKPVLQEMRTIAGTAFTVRVPPGDWLLAIKAIDEAKPGDVIVIDAGGADESRKAVWGELASQAAKVKGITGVVIHGYVRDIPGIREINFPVFASGITPRAGDPEGQGAHGITLDIGGVLVKPGDIIVADLNGVVVVPREKAAEVAVRAEEIHSLEEKVLSYILSKKTTLYRALQELGVFGKVK